MDIEIRSLNRSVNTLQSLKEEFRRLERRVNESTSEASPQPADASSSNVDDTLKDIRVAAATANDAVKAGTIAANEASRAADDAFQYANAAAEDAAVAKDAADAADAAAIAVTQNVATYEVPPQPAGPSPNRKIPHQPDEPLPLLPLLRHPNNVDCDVVHLRVDDDDDDDPLRFWHEEDSMDTQDRYAHDFAIEQYHLRHPNHVDCDVIPLHVVKDDPLRFWHEDDSMDTQDRYAHDFAIEKYHHQADILDTTISHLRNYEFDADSAANKDRDSPPDFFCYSSDDSCFK